MQVVAKAGFTVTQFNIHSEEGVIFYCYGVCFPAFGQ